MNRPTRTLQGLWCARWRMNCPCVPVLARRMVDRSNILEPQQEADRPRFAAPVAQFGTPTMSSCPRLSDEIRDLLVPLISPSDEIRRYSMGIFVLMIGVITRFT